MTGVNGVMLGLAGLAIVIFVGLFLFFRLRYSVAPPAIAEPAPRAEPVRPIDYSLWRLTSRSCVNPGSGRRPAYLLRLEPEENLPDWQPGALARIYPGPCDDILDPTVAVREYPVASLPSDGGIELLVRDEGESCSDWLCHGLEAGQRAALSIAVNPEFAPPADEVPLILIGNGVGIGGLRAYIRRRPPGTRNWLIFGEHSSAFDMLIGPEIADWVATGHLERCDLVFSRDGNIRRHVSDQIHDSANPLFDWVLADAAIYVCGRQGSLLVDIHEALDKVLGTEVLDALKTAGLYKQQSY